MKALEGLQPYVAEDQRVRDAVLAALMHDASADVRIQAISMLEPVDSDTSVRQVMRTVSTINARVSAQPDSTSPLAQIFIDLRFAFVQRLQA